jgi:hypothetical protein
MHVIVVERRTLQMPPWTPTAYAALAQRCLSHFPKQRPTFEQIAAEVAAMRAAHAA